jgi:hypothetical protein
VHVHVSQTDEKGLMTKKQLSVVDLAGSERIAKGKVEGVAREQAIEINSSLTSRGKE